jgi:DNA-binding transcriptional ArsR family regulator
MNESHMGDEISRPLRTFEIRDLETLKVIADSLRTRIFEQLIEVPRTVKEVAARLGLAPSRLYYHMGLLEEHGLIGVVEQRLVGNLVEKVYQAVASELDIAPELLSFEVPARMERINMLVLSTLDVTREDLARSLEARSVALDAGAQKRPRSIIVNRETHRIPESKADEFQAKVKALLDEFDSCAVPEAYDTEETHTYALTVAFYPRFDYPGEVDDEHKEGDGSTNEAGEP